MNLDDLIVASRAGADAPSAADRARVRAKLAERLRAEPPPASTRRRRWTTTLLLAAALFAFGTASAFEARRALRDAGDSAPDRTAEARLVEGGLARAARLPEPTTLAVAAPSPSPVVVPAASTSAPPREARAPVAPSGAASAGPLADEMALVQHARAALRNGSAAEALASLDRYDAEHRRGTFAQESAGLRVLALCEAGRVGEARARGAAFLRAYPRSPLAVRIRDSCAGERGTGP